MMLSIAVFLNVDIHSLTILIKSKAKNECSLSDACNILISENLMGSVDIKSCPWIDIDTPEAVTFINENPKKFTE